MDKKRLLLIDDEKDFVQLLKLNLEKTGLYEVDVAFSGEEGLAKAKSGKFDIFFVDFVMPEMDGVQTCKAIRAIYPDSELVMMSGNLVDTDWKSTVYSGEDGQVYAIDKAAIEKEIGKLRYLYKPFRNEQILGLCKKILAEKS